MRRKMVIYRNGLPDIILVSLDVLQDAFSGGDPRYLG